MPKTYSLPKKSFSVPECYEDFVLQLETIDKVIGKPGQTVMLDMGWPADNKLLIPIGEKNEPITFSHVRAAFEDSRKWKSLEMTSQDGVFPSTLVFEGFFLEEREGITYLEINWGRDFCISFQ